jgi:hypothetical protein
MDGKYAEVSWTAEDVQTLRPEMTTEQAKEALQSIEKHLRDRLVELGWEVMDDLLRFEGK